MSEKEKAFNIKGKHVGYTYIKDGKRYFESLSNTRATPDISKMTKALLIAKGVFSRYAKYHMSKGDEVSLEKARQNKQYSDVMEDAINVIKGKNNE